MEAERDPAGMVEGTQTVPSTGGCRPTVLAHALLTAGLGWLQREVEPGGSRMASVPPEKLEVELQA